MEKVKIPQDVAEAIKLYKHKLDPESVIDIEWLRKRGLVDRNRNAASLFRFYNASRENKIKVFSALVNGYEVEETPEEEVLKYYQAIRERSSRETNNSITMNLEYEATGIITTLNKLGIKIEGVNA